MNSYQPPQQFQFGNTQPRQIAQALRQKPAQAGTGGPLASHVYQTGGDLSGGNNYGFGSGGSGGSGGGTDWQGMADTGKKLWDGASSMFGSNAPANAINQAPASVISRGGGSGVINQAPSGGWMDGLSGMFSNGGTFSSGGAGGGGAGTYLGYANMAKDGLDIFDSIKHVKQGEEGRDKGSFGNSAMDVGKGAMSGFQAGGPVGAIVGAALGNEKGQWANGNREFMKSPKGIFKSELMGGTGARDLENWFGIKLSPKGWFK